MNSIPGIIKYTVLEDVRSQYPIPSPLLKMVDFIEGTNLFLYYRTYTLTTYLNPRDAVITGAVLHSGAKILGFSEHVKKAIYILCAFNLLERYRQIYEAGVNLKAAMQFKHPMYHSMQWSFKENKTSPVLSIWWNVTVKKYQQQTWKVIVCAAKLFREIFKTAAFLTDLVLLTKGDPTIEFYAYTDLAENIGKYGSDLKSNVKLLVEHSRSNESLGNRLLSKLGISQNIGNIVDGIIRENPNVFAAVAEQVEGAKENVRGILERREINLMGGNDKPSILPISRIIPYSGQKEVDDYFQNNDQPRLVENVSLNDLFEIDPGQLSHSQESRSTTIINNIKSLATSFAKNLSIPYLPN